MTYVCTPERYSCGLRYVTKTKLLWHILTSRGIACKLRCLSRMVSCCQYRIPFRWKTQHETGIYLPSRHTRTKMSKRDILSCNIA